MQFNIHTHSNFCDHALGNPREYVEVAIENGYKTLGFSEHSPCIFPNGFRSHYRLMPEDKGMYIKTILALKDEYKNDIQILVGLEMEYYPLYFADMLKDAKDMGVEYLLLGQHYTGSEYPDGFYAAVRHTDKNILSTYVNETIEGLKTGVFTYLAHPDLCNFLGDDDFYKKEMKRLCLTAKELNIPIELNLLGIRQNRHYPNPNFWDVAGQVGNKVILGIDAHAPEHLANKESFKIAEELIRRYSLKTLEKTQIINIQK